MSDRSRSELLLLGTIADWAYNDNLPIGDRVEIGETLTDYTLVLKETHGEDRDRSKGLVGFGGQAYFSEADNRLVIAFEGSDDSLWQDWLFTNAAMALGYVSDQNAVATRFAKQAIDEFARIDAVTGKKTEVVFAGHSLGGYLTQVAILSTHEYLSDAGHDAAQAVVFNSPGYGGLPADEGRLWPEAEVTYIYSKEWDLSSSPIHSLGIRLSDDIYYLPETVGHSLDPLLDALRSRDPIPMANSASQAFIAPTGHSDSNYWEVFNTALDQRRKVEIEWIVEHEGKRYTVAQQIIPGGDARSGTETGVNYVVLTSMWLEGGGMVPPSELENFGMERVAKGTRWDSERVDWQERCFLPHTPITLADGTTKPIAAVRPGDTVLSHDKGGALVPARVTRTFVNDVAHVLDFHGTGVTPGHAFLCGAGRFQGRHVPLLDILRDDGAVVRQDGSLMRAATGCAVGSDGDRRIEVVAADGATGWVRAATRLPGGATVAEAITQAGGTIRGTRVALPGAPVPQPFAWPGALPAPEDDILRRSGLTLAEIYAADEWESPPQMAAALDFSATPRRRLAPRHRVHTFEVDGTRACL